MRKFVIGGKLAILPPGGSPVGMYTHPICHQRALLIIPVQAHGRTRLSPPDYSVPLGPIESLGGTGPTFEVLGGTRAFQAHLDPRLHSQDWSGGGGEVGGSAWGWGSAATGQDVHQVISRCDHDLS